MKAGRDALDKIDWNVDIVLTHCLPESIQEKQFLGYGYNTNTLTAYLDEINSKLNFNLWFSGHYHDSILLDSNHYLIYNDIVKLTEDSFVRIHRYRT